MIGSGLDARLVVSSDHDGTVNIVLGLGALLQGLPKTESPSSTGAETGTE